MTLCCALVCLQGCGGVPFQGPTGHPKFEKMDWLELEVKYWVVKEAATSTGKWIEDEKSLTLKGKELDELKEFFETSSSRGSALGNIRPWLLSTDKGDWYFELTSPNTAFFCQSTNTDQAYRVELSSTAFYEKLKNHCLEDAKLDFPNVPFDSIRICRRFGGTQAPQETIVPFTDQTPQDAEPTVE
jgi:hypothetical protein